MGQTYVGIDPGKKGAIVIINENKEILESLVTPLKNNEIDLAELKKQVSRIPSDSVIFLEKVSSKPWDGVKSAFSFGKAFGYIEAMLVSKNLRYYLVTPQKWAKEIHGKIRYAKDPGPKGRTLKAAKKYFPGKDFLATKRSRVPHEGIVDALMIAYWGYLQSKKS